MFISRVYKRCIGNFAQIISKLVEVPNYMCHFTLWSRMADGNHLLAQTIIKHLLAIAKSHWFHPPYTNLLESTFLPQLNLVTRNLLWLPLFQRSLIEG